MAALPEPEAAHRFNNEVIFDFSHSDITFVEITVTRPDARSKLQTSNSLVLERNVPCLVVELA